MEDSFEGSQYEEEEEKEDPEELGKALIKAAANGNSEEVISLLKRRADVNYLDKKSWSPLMWASSKGHQEIVKILLDTGATSQNSAEEEQKSHKHSPLHWASFNGHINVVWLLMKRGFSPLDVDVYGNNCIHHATAGGRSEILETFLGQGVSVDHKNTRGHQPYDLATDSAIKEAIESAKKARKCKECACVFDIYKTRHFCEECKKYFCSGCCRVSWVFLTPVSEEEERPVCRCLNCENYLVSVEEELRDALDSGIFEKVDEVYAKITTNNLDINVKLVDLAKIEHKRLKTEKEINEFISSLSYVENYKTIQKSVYVLGEMVKKAQKEGVELAQAIIEKVEHEQKRLMSERNLRHEVATADFSIASESSVATLDSLIGSAKENKVQEEYTETASVIRQKLQDNIDAHYILARFVDYPLREYPEPEILDPRKRGPAKQEEKKAPARRKKEPKLLIPDWATEIVSLIKEVEGLERFLRRAEEILLDPEFVEEAKENIVRMRKEIRFREEQEEEARLEAERRAAAKKQGKK